MRPLAATATGWIRAIRCGRRGTASGLQRPWLAACERGGAVGARAARDLEAVTALFDITDQYVSRHARCVAVRTHRARRCAAPAEGQPGGLAVAEQVSVLSAHAALGHEWELVVVAGLQDGLWPQHDPRGGVLATQRLLDELDGVTEDASLRAPLVAEERRLLVAAMGRARRRLLVTAIDSETGGDGLETRCPSAFFYEIASVGRW